MYNILGVEYHDLDLEEENSSTPFVGLVQLKNGVKCLTCGRILSKMNSARRHFRIMHATDKEDRKFQCDFCPKTFTVECYKNDHMRASHGISQTMMKNRVIPKEYPIQ